MIDSCSVRAAIAAARTSGDGRWRSSVRVVLGEHRDDRTAALGPGRHLDRGGVEILDRAPHVGRPHVEAEGEHRRSGAEGVAGAR